MQSHVKQKLILSPEWTIRRQENDLLVSGGADALYSIEAGDTASFFDSLLPSKTFYRSNLSVGDEIILEQLLSAGIVRPHLTVKRHLQVKIIGDKTSLKPVSQHITLSEKPDLLILVRRTSSFAELLQNTKYETLSVPNIFIDVANHHTISLGPLVFFGETACLACLEGRLGNRWGEGAIPAAPRAGGQYDKFATSLLTQELERIILDQDYSLTNTTAEWDILAREVTLNKLHKVPFCPICSRKAIDFSKPLVLPWI